MSAQLAAEAASRFPYLTAAGHDHKAWAKRLVYRDERGDKTLSALQVKMAREAIHGTPPAAVQKGA